MDWMAEGIYMDMTSFKTELTKAMAAESKPYKVEALMQTPDVFHPLTQACIRSFLDTTRNVPVLLHVAHNKGMQPFIHHRETNRRLSITDAYLLTLDDDMEFTDNGWLEGLIAQLDSDPMCAAAVPSVRKHGRPYVEIDRPQYACNAGTACRLMRRVGVYFSMEYAHYYSDTDHALRLWEAGYKIIQTPEVVIHKPSHSLMGVAPELRENIEYDKAIYDRLWKDVEPKIKTRIEKLNKELKQCNQET